MKKQLFNDDWFFAAFNLGTTLAEIKKTDHIFDAVDIPHDWLIYNTRNLYKMGEGWYKKQFEIEQLSENDYISLRFEGIYQDSTVYLNGIQVCEWKNGYTTFEFDITDYLVEGVNEIIIRVIHESPNSRWYSGAGIYRNVWLKKGAKDHFIADGIYITPIKESSSNWKVEIDSEFRSSSVANYRVKHSILTLSGEIVTSTEQKRSAVEKDSQVLSVSSPRLWDVGAGNLYLVKSELFKNGELVDVVTNRFGFRKIVMSPDGGFVINNRRIKLFGVCQHHDLGALGAAVNKVALRRQFELLLEMGMNAIRTAHNVPAESFMELADEMGILVCSEIFDMWKNPKTTYDYARFFDAWAERDMAAWIRRDRNSPSIIMWSIGNEISDTHIDERGVETTKMLANLVKLHDPKGHAPATIGSNFMPWENARKCADVLKLAGYNYAEKYYHEHHLMYPDWMIYGSETASTVQSRGIYKFPLKQSVLADDDEQCSSLGNSSTSWGAKNTEACIIAGRDAPFSLGQFIWTGFDYIGEPTPYHTKNSYLGQIDTAGFFKDSAYIYQAEWTDYKEKPMVHLFPYWDFNEGQLIDIRVTSNAPKVELFFNDNSLGTFKIDHAKGMKLVGDWQLPYQKGTLQALAYNEHGDVIASAQQTSFGDAKVIKLNPNKSEMIADGQDLIFVEIKTVDEFGIYVANANNRVEVNVSGVGRLIGLDNGDSTDYDSYKGTSRRLFSGKLLAIIAANHEPGQIVMTVNSIGLTSATRTFNIVLGKIPVGTSKAFIANSTSAKSDKIPIRKIELISSDGNILNENLREVVVKAKIYPKQATHRYLQWRVTNEAGIDSMIANLKRLDDNHVAVEALGDGTFYLRCMTNNGAAKTRLISQLDFSVTGIGEAYLNPYDFIAGGLYSRCNIELTNGNERGVATDRELTSHVGFENVNFGHIGSDTITLPIFSLEQNEFPIEIWEGMPCDQGSEKVCEVTYDLGSKWNTYQEKTYQLPRKFKGVTTICFVFKQKVHLKGFSFVAPIKAYEMLWAIDYAFISGDAFVVTDNAVERIGNNVTLIFDEMDFASRGISKIQICGATPLAKNTIQIRFNDGENETIQIVEFEQSADYTVQEFELANVGVNQLVSFIFLPGCQFNFKWFKFL